MAEKHPYRHYPDSLSYQLIKTKLKVYESDNLNNTYKYFQTFQRQGTIEQRAVARYGAGLVDLNLQHFDSAEATFNRLIKQYPNQPQFIMAKALTAYEAKNYTKALTLFKNASKLFPNNKPIKIEYLSALLKTNHPKTAKQLLLFVFINFSI